MSEVTAKSVLSREVVDRDSIRPVIADTGNFQFNGRRVTADFLAAVLAWRATLNAKQMLELTLDSDLIAGGKLAAVRVWYPRWKLPDDIRSLIE